MYYAWRFSRKADDLCAERMCPSFPLAYARALTSHLGTHYSSTIRGRPACSYISPDIIPGHIGTHPAAVQDYPTPHWNPRRLARSAPKTTWCCERLGMVGIAAGCRHPPRLKAAYTRSFSLYFSVRAAIWSRSGHSVTLIACRVCFCALRAAGHA